MKIRNNFAATREQKVTKTKIFKDFETIQNKNLMKYVYNLIPRANKDS